MIPLPPNFFSVDSYDLKSMSFKFGNDIFITFEMPRVAYSRLIDKIHISLQFRPSVIRGPWVSVSKLSCYLIRIELGSIVLELVDGSREPDTGREKLTEIF